MVSKRAVFYTCCGTSVWSTCISRFLCTCNSLPGKKLRCGRPVPPLLWCTILSAHLVVNSAPFKWLVLSLVMHAKLQRNLKNIADFHMFLKNSIWYDLQHNPFLWYCHCIRRIRFFCHNYCLACVLYCFVINMTNSTIWYVLLVQTDNWYGYKL